MKKQLEEVKRLQKLANILKEEEEESGILLNFVKEHALEIATQVIGKEDLDEYPDIRELYTNPNNIEQDGDVIYMGEGVNTIYILDHEPTEDDLEQTGGGYDWYEDFNQITIDEKPL